MSPETIELHGHDPARAELMTHPIAEVETDGTPANTTVVLVLKDGRRVDVTHCCTKVLKTRESPIVELTLITLAPRADIDRRREIRVAV